MSTPRIRMFAGPNGSGKSTLKEVISENLIGIYINADEIRIFLMSLGKSFTFETVMSHESKTEILESAQAQGYRTYLYYIATEDPEINVSRVAYRVSQQGHDVPREKIISRYERSLDLLLRAIRATDRAYLFDNLSQAFERSWFAEVTEGTHFKLKTDTVPAWFMTNVIEKASNK